MDPKDLKETCLVQENRTLLQVSIDDSIEVEEILRKLMAKSGISSRKMFFESNGEML